MELEDDSCRSCCTCDEEKIRAVEIMEDHWFFQNVLYKERVITSSSDIPCREHMNEGVYSKAILSGDEGVGSGNLNEVPSDKDKVSDLKTFHGLSAYSDLRRSFMSIKSTARRPSFFFHGDGQDSCKMDYQNTVEKPKITGHRLIRQHSNIDGTIKDSKKKAEYRKLFHSRSSKSLGDLELEEIQGFLDLGFIFNKEDLSPSIQKMIPGLQDRRSIEDDKIMRPYLSEAWFVQKSDPPQLHWADGKSVADMKEQLRVWARAVASNVCQDY